MADRVSGDDDGSVSSDMAGTHLHPPSPYLPLIPADRRMEQGGCSYWPGQCSGLLR